MGLLRLILSAFFKRKPLARGERLHETVSARSATKRLKLPTDTSAGQQVVGAPDGGGFADLRLKIITGRCNVVDGDSIIIQGKMIRLSGIDAPELDHPYGRNAKWALINLCKGQTISAMLEEAVSYDRVVATCYLPDGRDLSAEMVKMGFAVDWAKFSGGKYRQFEVPDIRRKLWRCDARQKGRMPPSVRASVGDTPR